MDFVSDQLADGRRFRALTVVDLFTRECLAIEGGRSLRAEHVVQTLNRLKFERGLPERIYCDNGSEFSSGQTDLWAYTNQVQIDFSRRGRPTDNAVIESFNGRFREECLTRIGSNRSKTRRTKLTRGDGITMSIGLTALSWASRPTSSRQRPKRGPQSHSLDGPVLGGPSKYSTTHSLSG